MNSLQEIWNEIIKILSRELTPTAMTTWFSDCEPVALEDCRLILHTSSEFKRDIITKRFSDTIKAALSDLFSCEFDLLVLAGDELNDYMEKAGEEENILPEIAGYTFDRFIVGFKTLAAPVVEGKMIYDERNREHESSCYADRGLLLCDRRRGGG